MLFESKKGGSTRFINIFAYHDEELEVCNFFLVEFSCNFKLGNDIYIKTETSSKWFGLYNESHDIAVEKEALLRNNELQLLLSYFRLEAI